MNALALTLVDQHLSDLRNEAAAHRLAALGHQIRPSELPAWRRGLGAGADNLSLRLAGLAARLDPPRTRSGRAFRRYGAE